MNRYTRENLIRTDTFIVEWDGIDEAVYKEFDISYISLKDLRTVFTPEPEDDYELVFAYEISEEEATKLEKFLKDPIVFNFEKYGYMLARYGVYKEL